MRTPKESFLTSGHSAAFARAVASECFEPACQHALLQLQAEMPTTCHPGLPTDPYVSMDANSQMVGARRVLDILSTLSEPIKTHEPPKQRKLSYA